MPRRLYITINATGGVACTSVVGADPGGLKITKTLFELSRTTDFTTHFDPMVHTREVIAVGLEGHRPLALSGECDDTELPDDYFRDA